MEKFRFLRHAGRLFFFSQERRTSNRILRYRETSQSMFALLADVNVPENIARYVFCCTKLCLLQKTPCPAEGLGLASEVVMPVPFNI